MSWINPNDVKWPELKLLQNWWILRCDSLQLILISYLTRYVRLGSLLPSKLATERKTLSCEGKWVRIFNNFNEQNIRLPNLVNFAEFVFPLHGTSAPVERVFSVMNNVSSLDRNEMDESTFRALGLFHTIRFSDRRRNQRLCVLSHTTVECFRNIRFCNGRRNRRLWIVCIGWNWMVCSKLGIVF
jgi:hypothetical protein